MTGGASPTGTVAADAGQYSTPWLPVRPPDSPGIRLFCFPHAGAGSLAFQGWDARLPPSVHVLPVLPPGREARFWEAPYTHIQPYVADLAAALAPGLRAPYALFGHSLGALVAFELARSLRAADVAPPVHLFVSGRIAPQLTDHRPRLHLLPRDALFPAVATLGGVPAGLQIRDHLLDYLIPVLRADLTVNEAYEFEEAAPLSTAITALGGTDDPRAHAAELAAWGAQTSGPFRLQIYPGGHFYLADHRAEVLDLIARTLVQDGA